MNLLHKLGFRKTTVTSVRDHFKIKSKKMGSSSSRWSALTPSHRLAWSTLSSMDRRKIDETLMRTSSKRIAEHNKNYILNAITKASKKEGKIDIDTILSSVRKNPNIAHF